MWEEERGWGFVAALMLTEVGRGGESPVGCGWSRERWSGDDCFGGGGAKMLMSDRDGARRRGAGSGVRRRGRGSVAAPEAESGGGMAREVERRRVLSSASAVRYAIGDYLSRDAI